MSLFINRDLPLEVLSQIFLFQYRLTPLPLSPPKADEVEEFQKHPLLKSMLVCKLWHQVIYSTPSLWTLLWVGRGRPNPIKKPSEHLNSDSLDSWLQSVNEKINRSGALPIDALITIDHVEDVGAMVDTVIPSAHRWRTLHIYHESPDYTYPFDDGSELNVKRLLGQSMPLLESLGIRVVPDRDLHIYPLGTLLPSLKRLWSQGILIHPSRAPSLSSVTLKYLINSADSEPLAIPPPPSFQNLDELTMIITDNFLDLWSLFPSPSLKRLVVDTDHDVDAFSVDPESVEYPPLSQLKELHWSDRGGPHLTLTSILKKCSNLRVLYNYVPNSEIQALDDLAVAASTIPRVLASMARSPSSTSEKLLPNLECVAFDNALFSDLERLLELWPGIRRVHLRGDTTHAKTPKEQLQSPEHIRTQVKLTFGSEL